MLSHYPIYLIRSYCATYYGLPKVCYYGFFLSLFESIFIGLYYYLSIYFTDVLHFNISTTGIILSCYGIGAVFGGIISGRLSDKWSPELVSANTLVMQSIAYLLFLKAKTPLLLMGNVFMLGIASYGFITANHLFVLHHCDNGQRLKAINILSMTSNLGLGFSSLIINKAIIFGFDIIFLSVFIIVFLFSCISFICLYQINQGKINLLSHQENNLNENIAETPTQHNQKKAALILLSVFFIGLIITQLGATYSIYIKEHFPAMGMQAVTFLFALNSFIVVILETPLGEWLKKYNKIMMVGIGAFLIGYGMLLLNISTLFIMAIFSCILYTVGEIIFFSISQLVCYQNGLQNKKGKSLGLYRMVYASSRVLGPTLGGTIYFNFGGNIIWTISGMIGLTCLTLCYFYRKLD